MVVATSVRLVFVYPVYWLTSEEGSSCLVAWNFDDNELRSILSVCGCMSRPPDEVNTDWLDQAVFDVGES